MAGIVFTGAMGGGKTTLLGQLALGGLSVVPEAARQILAEQRSFGGRGVPETDPELFCQLMLSRCLHDRSLVQDAPRQPLFDRAVPDLVAYARLFDLDDGPYLAAARVHRYHPVVLWFPPWQEIYTHDDERKIPYEGAAAFGLSIREVYTDLGYEVREVPRVGIEERRRWLEDQLRSAAFSPGNR